MGKMYSNGISNSPLRNIQVSHPRAETSFYTLVNHLTNPISTVLGLIRMAKDIHHEYRSQKIIHIHDLDSSLLIALSIEKLFKLPFVIQIHGFPLREQYIKLMKEPTVLSNIVWGLTKTWHNLVVRFIRISSAQVIVNNAEVRAFYESCGILPDKLRVLPSSIDLQKHEKQILHSTDAEEYLGIKRSKNEIIIGYIGGLRPEKNVDALIIAFRDLLRDNPEVKARLVIIGDGPRKTFLEEVVEKNNLGSLVLFLGFIPNAYRFLNALDIFVLPSLSEGSPLSLIEAMVAGKAIIASDLSAMKEIVTNEKEALLVDSHNLGELKRALLRLYGDSKLRKTIGEKAREKAKQYDVNRILPEIIQIYWENLKNCMIEKDKKQNEEGLLESFENPKLV